MAYSFVTYTSAGGQTYSVPFPYLDVDHVKVLINGVETTAFTWSDAATIHLNAAPAVGAIILIKRETPRDGMDNSFSAQPRLKGGDLDEALLQTYYIGLEALDGTQLDWDAVEAKDLALAAQAAAEAAADLAATYTGSAGAGTYMEVPAAPSTDVNEVKMYAKDVTGVAELFIRKESNGAEIQVTSGGILNGTELATQAETDAGALDTKIVTPAKLYATPGVYRKNAVINGDMMVWQRGTTFTASADGAFHADRWSHIAATDAVVTVSKSTNVPTDAQGIGRFAASLQVDVTTADTSIGSGQAHAIRYKVEGYDIRGLVGQVCTLSFWVYATKTGIYCVNLLCSGADHSYVKEYTINSANTWEKKTITFTLDASSGTWDFTNGVGLQIRWTLAAGSNYQTATDGVWGTALYATANQVNGLDSSDNYFLLTGVQLEKGSAATPFEYRHFAEELALCQRYFEKSYEQSTTPGTANDAGRIFFSSAVAYDYGYCSFKVTKRAAATVVFYSPKNGASGYCHDYSSGANVALTGYSSEFGADFSGPLTTAHLFAVHYTASAEL